MNSAATSGAASSREAGWEFVAADYSQIELRLLAHLSGDPAFVKAFNAGGDIHRQTAALIFDVPLDEVTAEMRARAKTINFATIYGQGAHALSRQLKIEHAEAKRFIETYFERFAGVRSYSDRGRGSRARARVRGDDSSGGAATSPSSTTRTSTSAHSASVPLRTRRSRDRRPT